MGMEKGLVKFMGKPLILRAISTLKSMCGEVILSTNSNAFQSFGIRVVGDKMGSIGPMGGIASCLEESATDINLVLSCDMPFVRMEVFEHLHEKIGENWISVPWHGEDKYEPMCGIYRRDALPQMMQHIEQFNPKLPDFFKTIPVTAATIDEKLSFYESHMFFNINTPEQLAEAEKIYRNKSGRP
jgi:molybdopterin-guanine dinucleotide biosynthesis protein A